MNSISDPRTRQRGTYAALAASLPLALCTCAPGDIVEIDTVRNAPPEVVYFKAHASSAERFGNPAPAPEPASPQAGEPPFVWETPASWVELPAQKFRDLNFQPAGNPELECYLTILQGDGGGMTANVNRWRGQLGLGSISDDEVQELPTGTLFQRPALQVELIDKENTRALMGVIFLSSGFMATVKMTGPPELVEEQRGGFDQFCETLTVRAGGDTSADKAPLTASNVGVETPAPKGPVSFDMPDGWSDAGANSMRIVNLTTPAGSQCYIIRLPGEAGGLAANLNRWQGEVGLDPLSEDEIAALPQVDVLGRSSGLLELTGDYKGMGSLSGPGKKVLGIALIDMESSLFIKMVGDEADVDSERAKFMDFLTSLQDA
ncbi:MAG: hypothetical protein ACI835_000503 [Planctomycetota bacterium]